MHFVKKVPTSEEEKEANAKKRAAKLRIFCATRDSVVKKRSQGQLDEELLVLSGNMLMNNPEITTLWNIRREIINHLLKEQEMSSEGTDTAAAKKKELLPYELTITEKCLQKNSKSYGAWFHRGWAIERLGEEHIAKDLETAERFLGIDGRNFHCWDYRRLLVTLGKVEPKAELEFSTRLINRNFSNYSSWHYRSVLLSKMFPGCAGKGEIDEERLAAELEMVSNAFFMDPEDQSAWIYTEWLLRLQLNQQLLGNCAGASDPTVITVTFLSSVSGYIVMDRPVTTDLLIKCLNCSSWKRQLQFIPVSQYKRAKSSAVFVFNANDFGDDRITFSESEGLTFVKKALGSADSRNYINKQFLVNFYNNFSSVSANCVYRKAIEYVAEKCDCLIQENAKNINFTDSLNRWPLFIRTLCLMCLDPRKHFEQILVNFEELKNKCDSKRSVMYGDMCAVFQLKSCISKSETTSGKVLEELIESADSDRFYTLSLRNIGLRNLNCLIPLSGLIKSLDLSDNFISDLRTLVYLRGLTNLTLNNNKITSINPLSCLRQLKLLSVAENPISQYEDVHEVIENVHLEKFIVCGTPLANEKVAWDLLCAKCKQVRPELKLVRHWL